MFLFPASERLVYCFERKKSWKVLCRFIKSWSQESGGQLGLPWSQHTLNSLETEGVGKTYKSNSMRASCEGGGTQKGAVGGL